MNSNPEIISVYIPAISCKWRKETMKEILHSKNIGKVKDIYFVPLCPTPTGTLHAIEDSESAFNYPANQYRSSIVNFGQLYDSPEADKLRKWFVKKNTESYNIMIDAVTDDSWEILNNNVHITATRNLPLVAESFLMLEYKVNANYDKLCGVIWDLLADNISLQIKTEFDKDITDLKSKLREEICGIHVRVNCEINSLREKLSVKDIEINEINREFNTNISILRDEINNTNIAITNFKQLIETETISNTGLRLTFEKLFGKSAPQSTLSLEYPSDDEIYDLLPNNMRKSLYISSDEENN